MIADGTPEYDYLQRFDLSSGRPVGAETLVPDVGACGPAWGERLVVQAGPGPTEVPRSGPLALAADRDVTETLTVAYDREDARCAVWASNAFTDRRGEHPFGTRSDIWTWWSRKLLAGLLLAVVLIWARNHRRLPRVATGGLRRSHAKAAEPERATGADWYREK